MKLITNKDYDSIMTYFVGIDYPDGWTIENPAVYHEVKSGNQHYVKVPSFQLISQSKYLLFYAEANIDYMMYSSDYDKYFDSNFKIYFYNYLNYNLEDMNNNINYIYHWEYENNNYNPVFKFDYSTFILMKIVPVYEYSLNRNLNIYFSNPPLEFDYSDHWIRDLQRVDGKSWNYNGKVNYLKSLSLINRLHQEAEND